MMIIINWIKKNKLTSILLLILVYLLFNNVVSNMFGLSMMRSFSGSYEPNGIGAPSPLKMSLPISGGGGYGQGGYDSYTPAPPNNDVTNRMVVQNSYLSLVVKNVASTLSEIKSYTAANGGYMVSSNLDNPQDNTSGSITLRIPSEKLDTVLAKFRTLAVKVASERLDGTDVTDQFIDNEARMSVLNSNLTRFKELMGQAKEISDILKIQQEVFSLQSQIDSIKGQNKYMEQTAKLSLVTVYLSTDEFSLPYAPSEPWRADVIFKTAVRSLVGNVRKIGTAAIWLAVYSPVWGPVLVIFWYLNKRRKPSQPLAN